MTTAGRGTRIRRQAGWLCLGLSAFLVLAPYLPPLSYPIWLLRLFGRELALLSCTLSAIALALLSSAARSPPPVFRRATTWVALLLIVLGSLPVTTTFPLFARYGLWFSPWQYLVGAPAPTEKDGLVEERDVALAKDRPELLVDVYRPSPATTTRAAVVIIHGGSFARGDKGDVPQVSRALAQAGYTAFDLRYRLAPQHPFPAAVQDILCIVGRLAEPTAMSRFAIDGRRIALLGRSAGGTLALTSAYAAAAQKAAAQRAAKPSTLPALLAGCAVVDVAPQAVIAIYPWVDLRHVYEQPPRPDALDSPGTMQAYLGGSPQQLPGPYSHASPVFYARESGVEKGALPPTLLLHGTADTLVPAGQSEVLADDLRRAGYAPWHVAIPMAEHGFDHRSGGAGEQLERALVLRFLREALPQ